MYNSKDMLDNGRKLILTYKYEVSRSNHLRKYGDLSKVELIDEDKALEEVAIAIAGLMLLMNESDRVKMAKIIKDSGLNEKLVDAMNKLKNKSLKDF